MRLTHEAAKSYLNPQMLPKGAPMLVTKLIMAKMKHMVMIATRFVFLLVLIVFVVFDVSETR